MQDKHYPRDWFIRCRLRVTLKKEDGSLVNPEIPNSERVLLLVACMRC